MSGDNICNEESFNEIFRLHSRELHDFLYYKYGMDNNPKDLVQEAFLKLWDNCHKILPGSITCNKKLYFMPCTEQGIHNIPVDKTGYITTMKSDFLYQ